MAILLRIALWEKPEPLDLMATSPCTRSIPLTLPKVYSTKPRRTNSRLASSTSSRNDYNSIFAEFSGQMK